MKGQRLVFGIRSYADLARKIASCGEWTAGKVEVHEFPDGERYQRILRSVTGREVVLVGGTVDDRDTLELYDLACSLVKYGARKLDLIIPYFGYGTMERAVQSGEVVTAKTRARLLSSIPPAPGGIRAFLLDVHSEGVPHYFEGAITTCHVYGKPFVAKAARMLAKGDFVLASTDAGRAKWVQSLAEDMGVDASFVFKRRLDGRRTAVTAVSAHVEKRHVIIYDDMIRTGGSLLNAAEAYRDAGASKIDVVTTHGLFPGDALERIQESGLIGHIHATDSHPGVRGARKGFLTVHPTAPLFVEALNNHP